MNSDEIIYTVEQEEGIELCADRTKTIVCVTGQAGTGKTTILKGAVKKFMEEMCELHGIDVEEYQRLMDAEDDRAPFTIKLCAPTGRAAKRIEEATGLEAMTIHRMLRFSVPIEDDEYGLPAYNSMNRMPHDAIFVDEASMLDEKLRSEVIAAMKRGCVIRFFGDVNQLPPIQGPSPFAVDLKKYPSVTLTENFRSTDGIIALADRVIKNKMPLANEKVAIQRVVSTQGTNTVLKLAEKIDFTRETNQIICPTNNTKHGTVNINRVIQQRFNPETDKLTMYVKLPDGSVSTKSFKRGDKILWTKNDYNVGLMNGSLGRVIDFDDDTGEIVANFDGTEFYIPSQMESFNPTTGEKFMYDPRKQIDLGYAISTHKSQGSQFDFVCYAVSRSRAATRQNVYTAVTRAKDRLHIVNIGGALSFALDNPVKI